MKYYESQFDEYINKIQEYNLHPELNTLIKQIPKDIGNLTNIILYGPPGTGKYTQALSLIKIFSPTGLKYEKKMLVTYNKQDHFIKISDIHYEVDMSLLGCNSKLLWHEIYLQIIDIICTKPIKQGIIVCKHFHEIHSELLEIFYSYMQKNNLSIDLSFIIITKAVSFLPENIINCCKIVNICRPTKKSYSECVKQKLKLTALDGINNIKYLNLHEHNENITVSYKLICDKIVTNLINVKKLQFLHFRDLLYDILIYDLDLNNCIWYIISTLVNTKHITNSTFTKVLLKTFTFLKYYNNNYRPIYHLEGFFLYIAQIINFPTDSALP